MEYDVKGSVERPSAPPIASWLPRTAALFAMLIVLTLVTVNVWLLNSQLSSTVELSQERAFWQLCHAGATEDQRTESFLRLVAAGNSEWKSARLERLSLRGTDLQQADLTSAKFSYCQLTAVNFRQAVLDRSVFENCELNSTVFDGASLKNATLFKSELGECSFRNTELLSASLEQVKAVDASFVAAKMGDAFLAMADLTGADLTGADLNGANLEAAILRNTDLALTNLYGTHLTDTDFTNANWWRSRGLSTTQLDDLTVRFAPDQQASDSRRRDFAIWLQQRIDSDDSNRNK